MFGKRKTYFYMKDDPKYSKYSMGPFSYGSPEVLAWDEGATLKVGSFCSLAPDVTILLGGEHRVDWITTYPFNILFKEHAHITGHPKSRGDVVIGNDVWIGRGALILSGVKIGDGAVIGAASVVTKDAEPYSVVAGNPAKLIRKRFSEKAIASLLKIKWWEWDLDRIKHQVPLLLSGHVEKFVKNNS